MVLPLQRMTSRLHPPQLRRRPFLRRLLAVMAEVAEVEEEVKEGATEEERSVEKVEGVVEEVARDP